MIDTLIIKPILTLASGVNLNGSFRTLTPPEHHYKLQLTICRHYRISLVEPVENKTAPSNLCKSKPPVVNAPPITHTALNPPAPPKNGSVAHVMRTFLLLRVFILILPAKVCPTLSSSSFQGPYRPLTPTVIRLF